MQRHRAHVLGPDGVTRTWFERTADGWASPEPIPLGPGGMLVFDAGLPLRNGESITFDCTFMIDVPD